MSRRPFRAVALAVGSPGDRPEGPGGALLRAGLPGFRWTELPEEAEGADLLALVILGGGSEPAALAALERLAPADLALVAGAGNNALAAGLELRTRLSAAGRTRRLLYADEADGSDLDGLERYRAARARLRGERWGLVGGPSPWLVGSPADPGPIEFRLGVECVARPLEPLMARFLAAGPPPERVARAEAFAALLLDFAAAERFDALTLRCFDLVGALATTGCLALSRLADAGVTAGCEGDLPSLLSLRLAELLSGSPCFLANPSRIDRRGGRITLAHCTVPSRLVGTVDLPAHYETGVGVAVQGELSGERFLVYKTDGRLERHLLAEGRRVAAPRDPHACRTQVTLEVGEGLPSLLAEPIGNHLVVVPAGGLDGAAFRAAVELFATR